MLGAQDRNLSYLELILARDITTRGLVISMDGEDPSFPRFMARLEKVAEERGVLTEAEIFMEHQALGGEGGKREEAGRDLKLIVGQKSIWPKSAQQRRYLESLFRDQVVFSQGPAGTGKTFLAVCYALSQVLAGKKQKLILTRPVVEAGESLGFLPGDLMQKLSPYLKPLYDSMEYVLSPAQIKRLEENGAIEISPLAYMRGRSLNHCVVILDEAQNATKSQMKMFLTRLGEDAKAIITGDTTQIDLPRKTDSGLSEAMRILDGIDGVSVTEFTHEDTVRSRIVREIVRAYSRLEETRK